jgi:hypothetical protein
MAIVNARERYGASRLSRSRQLSAGGGIRICWGRTIRRREVAVRTGALRAPCKHHADVEVLANAANTWQIRDRLHHEDRHRVSAASWPARLHGHEQPALPAPEPIDAHSS